MKNGFTLIELSIVLVIIGLIIGGITAGADLIRAAELKSVVTDVNQYKTALHTFRLKFNALPGDMDNASSYWPTECVDENSTFCNGNGDDIFSDANGDNGWQEGSRAWQHMGLAEILSNRYDGKFTGGATIGGTYPQSSIDAMGFQFIRIGTASSCTGTGSQALYGVNNRDIIMLGSTNSACLNRAGLLPIEAQNIDTKLDDGLADTGRALGVNGVSQTGCAGDWLNSVTSADYDLTSETNTCRMVFLLDQ